MQLDIHQGNGTADIFRYDQRVTTFDMFCDANPWKSRRPATIDVPVASDIDDATYLEKLHSWLPKLAELQPQLVIFQAGVDALQSDAFGKMKLSREALNKRNNLVLSFALFHGCPMVVTMGGGYAKPDVSPSVAAHADVYRTAALRLRAFQQRAPGE
jgi:acetoin utilization deacetylase AcuC-like enzyme